MTYRTSMTAENQHDTCFSPLLLKLSRAIHKSSQGRGDSSRLLSMLCIHEQWAISSICCRHRITAMAVDSGEFIFVFVAVTVVEDHCRHYRRHHLHSRITRHPHYQLKLERAATRSTDQLHRPAPQMRRFGGGFVVLCLGHRFPVLGVQGFSKRGIFNPIPYNEGMGQFGPRISELGGNWRVPRSDELC